MTRLQKTAGMTPALRNQLAPALWEKEIAIRAIHNAAEERATKIRLQCSYNKHRSKDVSVEISGKKEKSAMEFKRDSLSSENKTGANLTRLQGLEFHRHAGAAAPKDLRVSVPLQNAMTRKRLAEAHRGHVVVGRILKRLKHGMLRG